MLPVAHFYYSTTVPQGAVAIAQVQAPDYAPSDLVQVTPTSTFATLTATSYPAGVAGTVFTATGLNVPVAISGTTNYLMGNQFFQITNQTDSQANPLFFCHRLPVGVTQVSITDLAGDILSGWVLSSIEFTDGTFPSVLHSLDPATASLVQYYDSQGQFWQQLLRFTPLFGPATATSTFGYTYANAQLGVASSGTYWLRFVQQSGLQLLPPYDTLPNNPWYARIRFNPPSTPMEYGQQNWSPTAPFLFASWVSGAVLDEQTVELERKNAYSSANPPDLIVYDQNYTLKYALAGSTDRSGFLPWAYNQISDFEVAMARARVLVALDPTDKVFAFYTYAEGDVEFRALDMNPYVNPQVLGNVVTFYFKANGVNPLVNLYYAITDSTGAMVATNDTSPTTGTSTAIGSATVGSIVGASQFQIWDARERGGGLSPTLPATPLSDSFFDIGYWDGKPYPLDGVQIVYLPVTLQATLDKLSIDSLVGGVLPIGSLPVIRYYDPVTGYESV